MFQIASRKSLGAALLAGVFAIGLAAASSSAEARPRGGHGHHGGHGAHAGHRFHGGHGFYRGPWGWGYGVLAPRRVVAYGGCYIQRRYDADGFYIGRVRVCP